MTCRLLFVFCLLISHFGFSQEIYYEVLDAAEANFLFSSLKTDSTNVNGWPLPEGRVLASEWNNLGWDVYNDFSEVSWEKLADESILYRVKIKDIELGGANLAGVIPMITLDSLQYLEIGFNEITGIADPLQLPSLNRLEIRYSKLSSFPVLNTSKLKFLDLSNNLIQGSVPKINLSKLEFLDLADNQFESIEGITAPVLRYLDLDNNKLKGSLNNIHAPSLEFFTINSNLFEGEFDLSAAVDMYKLDIANNNFTSLGSAFATRFPAMDYFDCDGNKLHFDDLLGLENRYPDFSYGGQQPVPFEIESNEEEIILKAKIGGAETYEWYYITPTSPIRKVSPDSISLYGSLYISYGLHEDIGIQLLENVTSSSYSIAKTENPSFYFCAGVHSLLPELKIVATKLKYEGIACWENEYFSFCFIEEDGEWVPGEEDNQMVATKPLSVNGMVLFDGKMTLDTSALSIKLDGKLYLKDIPIPGGSIGDFTLAKGEYELSLGGEQGKITGFLNDALSTFTPSIGGLELKLEDLQLVGGKSADGISLGLQVSWDNITPSCGGPDQTTAIKLSGLQITRSNGISVDGMKVTDLGLAPGFCVKNLEASYNSQADKLTFGLTLLTPFIEVGGGLGFISGQIDSVAMRAVLQDAIIPLGSTGIGIIGCEGRVNHLSNPPLNVKFGGIISSVLNDNLFQLTTSVEFIPPNEIKLELGDGKFFNPPFYDDWWLGEGGVYGQLDFDTYRLKLGGELKFSPYRDENGVKKFMADGSAVLGYRKSSSGGIIAGEINGNVTIPKLNDGWPYDWMNKQLGLPHGIQGQALLVYKSNTKYITGNVNFGGKIGNVKYTIDLKKSYSEDGFFSFQADKFNLSFNSNTRSTVTMNVLDKTPLIVLKIENYNAAVGVQLTDPEGKVITLESPGENSEIIIDAENNKAFWNLYSPIAGSWQIDAENINQIDYYTFSEKFDFALVADVTDDGVWLRWNNEGFQSTDQLDLYLDEDQEGFDGGYLTSVNANEGKYFLPYYDATGFCDFYILGMITKDGIPYAAYIDEEIFNPFSSFIPVDNITWDYKEDISELSIYWDVIDIPIVAGYVVREKGPDSIRTLAMLFPKENQYVGIVENFNPDNIEIYSYGLEGQSSCPVTLQSATSVEGAVDYQEMKGQKMILYPNPAKDIVQVKINTKKRQQVEIRLYNGLGQAIKVFRREISEYNPVFDLNLSGLLNNHYYLQVIGEEFVMAGKFLKID